MTNISIITHSISISYLCERDSQLFLPCEAVTQCGGAAHNFLFSSVPISVWVKWIHTHTFFAKATLLLKNSISIFLTTLLRFIYGLSLFLHKCIEFSTFRKLNCSKTKFLLKPFAHSNKIRMGENGTTITQNKMKSSVISVPHQRHW